MFDLLSAKLGAIFSKLKNRGILTKEIIDSTIREIRISLLEADVALPVVREFTARLKEQLDGQKVIESVSPEQTIIKIVSDEIVNLLTDGKFDGHLRFKKPHIILMCGLQGTGKTSSSAKLANYIKTKYSKKILLVSCDTYRPAAIEQLQKLAQKAGVDFFDDIDEKKDTPLSIAEKAYKKATNYDVIIFDTAGRLYIDDDLMAELRNIQNIITPSEKLLVIDAMMGQDALNTAKSFNDQIGIDGIVLTRVDGDSRGGSALSARYITNSPIKFMTLGEKLNDIELFHAERIASRILDKGDIVSLVEKAMDQNLHEDMMDMKAGKDFDFNDMEKYFKQMNKLGGISGMLKFLPGMGKIKEQLDNAKLDSKIIDRQVAIIRSMTKLERSNPKVLNASRKRRIAKGSGTDVQEVNKLIKQFEHLKTMMSRFAKAQGNPRNLMGLFK